VYGVCFGACEGRCSEAGADTEAFPYLIGWEATPGVSPEGLVEMKVQAGTFAVFSVTGDAGKIQEAVQAIYGEWLPSSGKDLADAPTLEKYAVDWKGANGDCMEIWLPVQERK
jgi:AraC family transcriptional regulator